MDASSSLIPVDSRGRRALVEKRVKIERSFRLSGCSASGVKVVLDVLAVLGDEVGRRLHVSISLDDLLRIGDEAKAF